MTDDPSEIGDGGLPVGEESEQRVDPGEPQHGDDIGADPAETQLPLTTGYGTVKIT